MKILKFGGTSVANSANIKLVKEIVLTSTTTSPLIVVVSAFGGVTDFLLDTLDKASNQDPSYREGLTSFEDRHLDAVRELFPVAVQSSILSTVKNTLNNLETLLEGASLIGEATPKLTDKVVSYGELLSSYIISEYFKDQGLNAQLKSGRELITTNEMYGKAAVDFETTNNQIMAFFENTSHTVTIVPGFVAATASGAETTLGRGGSDYTAALIAGALGASILEIWTDVSGMYTANPKLVKQAKSVAHISYEEAMELSHFGAKVLYPPTIQPVLSKGIPIVIKNTFAPEQVGTLITKNKNGTGKTVRGISHVDGISLLSLEGPGMVGIPGISKRFFETLALEDISVVMITQASSEHSICIGISAKDSNKAAEALNKAFEYEILSKKIAPVTIENELAIIALIGDNMKSHQGLSGKMFSTLGKNNVNIRAIAQGASERNISAVIGQDDVKKAVNTLHEQFFEENTKQLNLFVMGVGNVGANFLNQIRQQKTFLKEELKLNIRVIGISNSRTMLFDAEGISLDTWKNSLSQGKPANIAAFIEAVKTLNLRNSIFVDNTASAAIASTYSDYLGNSIAVVTCNKIACSSEFTKYKNLKELSKKYNAPFLFETNAIIDTLKHLIASGDKVNKIQAVLSGSLNFVFNNFNDTCTFHDVVKQAQEEGYTEPDPTIDLSGVDVMRKILILARESGHQLDLEAIENDSFLPKECLETASNEAFFESLKKYESSFQKRYSDAQVKGSKLKYVAQFENGKAKVGLQQVPKSHDFYNLEGSDNIVLFYTERYPDQPMIIKGAGAGADVTASGIFADIIRIGNY